MMPGMTTSPVASIVWRAPERRPMSVIPPSLMPMSARRRGRPLPSTTVPPLMIVSKLIGSSSRHPADVLELGVRLERPAAAVAADSRELVAAERCVGVERAAVHLHGARAHPACHAQAAVPIARPDVAVKPVVGVVRERDRLGLVRERDRADHGAEDLLPRDPH